MVAPDHDRAAHLAGSDELVEARPSQVALAVAEPADPRRQPLEAHTLLGELDPAPDVVLIAEQVEDRGIGDRDIGRVAGQRDPWNGPLPSQNSGRM